MRSINNGAPVTCTKIISINADSKKVWTVLTDIDHWTAWQTAMSQSKVNGELQPGTSFDWKMDGAKIRSTLHTVEPYSRVGWTGRSYGMFAIHNWTIRQANNQTVVEVNESIEGFLATVFRKPFNKKLDKDLHKWLGLLKQECENA